VAQLTNAVALKVHVLARNVQPTQGYTDTKSYQLGSVAVPAANDAFKRHVYSTSVRLTNVSMRRETP
jgi:type IV pilus assembly protein PilW